jgi:hypothetical protein
VKIYHKYTSAPLCIPYQELEKRMNGFRALDSVLCILQVTKLALCGDVVAQLPPTCFHGEIRHSVTVTKIRMAAVWWQACTIPTATRGHKIPPKRAIELANPTPVALTAVGYICREHHEYDDKRRTKDLSKPRGRRCAG